MTQDANTTHQPFVIEWRQGFRVHIDQVDDEHEELFRLIKNLNLASVDRTVNELLNYIVVHFSNEQALMEEFAYPGLEQHMKLHEDFAARVVDLIGGGDSWTEQRVQELRRFLNKWLVGHILTHDIRFGKWHADALRKAALSVQAPAGPVIQAAKVKAHRGLLANLFGLR